jgi:hypothetical protein
MTPYDQGREAFSKYQYEAENPYRPDMGEDELVSWSEFEIGLADAAMEEENERI